MFQVNYLDKTLSSTTLANSYDDIISQLFQFTFVLQYTNSDYCLSDTYDQSINY